MSPAKKKKRVPPRKPKKNMKGRKRGGATVACPHCGDDSEVIITRRVPSGVHRRRQCMGHQQHIFETMEMVACPPSEQ